jgi:hypothetical protein
MDNQNSLREIGAWSFVIGLILAIFAGFAGIVTWVPVTLFILGLIVGFLNIGRKETSSFLLALATLLLIGLGGFQVIGMAGSGLSETIQAMLQNFISFLSAAGLIVSIKSILAVVKTPSLPKKSDSPK